jgi:hypothetical protein
MVGSTKESLNFAQSALLSRGIDLRQFWTQRGIGIVPLLVESKSLSVGPFTLNANSNETTNLYFVQIQE